MMCTKKTQIYAWIHLQLSDLQYNKTPLKRCKNAVKNAYFPQRLNGFLLHRKLDSWR